MLASLAVFLAARCVIALLHLKGADEEIFKMFELKFKRILIHYRFIKIFNNVLLQDFFYELLGIKHLFLGMQY